MKKIFFTLVVVLLFGVATFFGTTTQISKNVTVWETYYSKEFKFSVDYPGNLIPADLHNESEVGFYATPGVTPPMRIRISTIPFGAEPLKYSSDLQKISQTNDKKHVVIEFVHVGKVYTVILDNFSEDDAQHILQSLRF